MLYSVGAPSRFNDEIADATDESVTVPPPATVALSAEQGAVSHLRHLCKRSAVSSSSIPYGGDHRRNSPALAHTRRRAINRDRGVAEGGLFIADASRSSIHSSIHPFARLRATWRSRQEDDNNNEDDDKRVR
jgi:hypothetical protein